ncbi:hypothetical protein FRC06_007025 [Ceratobasidium sp. 370]|nr:hypothetical protein FRC06_007025 [Ceratobasidium sp. 370]
MPGFAADWPAIGKWWSKAYLLACSGRGRVVPIERGGDYRTEDWGVDIMPWDVFLDRIGWGESQTEPTGDAERLYLAQHSLFTQFPKLRADLLIPDYVYTTPSTQPPDYSGPPGNDEQLVINAWCGGRGANSPAHTDPYYNIYVQVVGYKRIWLAPPDATPGMYVYNKTSNDDEKTTGGTSMDRDPKRDGMLGNTSSVDVFALSAPDSNSSEHPLFYTYTLPLAQSTTLRPGDALVIPPGWWHAMRGVDSGSFSVSFWF